MSRLIDANALIAEMHNVILEDGEDRRTFYEVIERQPTIEERKTGEWIIDDHDEYAVCDRCGEPCASYVMGKPRDNFCKWCGADMRGDNDEPL